MERRPRMLKDFLSDNLNSCSSSGFKSLPRKPTSMHTLIEMELKSSSSPPSNSPFQILMNTIRSISFFNSMRKSPSVLSLPRSLSRKLSSSRRRRTTRRTRSEGCNDISITTVKIKDIIRWKSFRDIVEPPPPPLDFMVEPTTTTTTATWSTSSGSSWSESDFLTSSWEDPQNDSVEAGKRFSFSPLVVGKDPKATVSNNFLSQIFFQQFLVVFFFVFFFFFFFFFFCLLFILELSLFNFKNKEKKKKNEARRK